MSKKQLVEDIKLNPARFYHLPSDVLRDRRFSDSERLQILAAWEREACKSTDADGHYPYQGMIAALQDAQAKIPPPALEAHARILGG